MSWDSEPSDTPTRYPVFLPENSGILAPMSEPFIVRFPVRTRVDCFSTS